VAAGVLALGLRFGEVAFGPWLGHPSRLHLPIAEVAARIRATGFQRGTVVAGDTFLGGNLRLHFPDSRILTPALAGIAVPAPPGPGQCLVAWRPRRESGPAGPLLEFAGEELGRPPLADTSIGVEVSLRAPGSGSYRLRLLPVPPGAPPCDRAIAGLSGTPGGLEPGRAPARLARVVGAGHRPTPASRMPTTSDGRGRRVR
jgi:hypothetical protein